MNDQKKWTYRYADLITRCRWRAIFLTLIVFVSTTYGLRYVTFADSYRAFFSESNPYLQANDSLERTYTKLADTLLVALEPKEGDVFKPEFLSVVESFTEDAWQLPHAARVSSLTNFQNTRADGDDIFVEDLIRDARDLTPEALESIRETALNEPLLVGLLLSPKADITGVFINLELPGRERGEAGVAVAQLRTLASTYEEEHQNLNVYLTGGSMLSDSINQYTMKDLSTLTPLMYLLIWCMVGILLRSIVATLGAVLVILFSVASAVGVTGWFGIAFTPPSAAMPTIVLTLAVADSIHILVTLLTHMRAGDDQRTALIESIQSNLIPILTTSLTTCIGFLSMNFSGVPPLADMGNMTAIGMVFALFYAIVFLPALLALIPMRVSPTMKSRTALMDRLANWVINRNRSILWVSVALVLLAFAFIPQNSFRNNFSEWFSPRTTFRADSDYIRDHLVGYYNMHFSVGAGESGGVTDPVYLAKLDEFADWIAEQPHVVYVNTITHVFRRLNRTMNGDHPGEYSLPQSQDLAAQYLLLYEMSLPYGMDLNTQINVDKSASRLTVMLDNVGSADQIILIRNAEQWLHENAPDYMFTHPASTGVVFISIIRSTIVSMLTGTPLALCLVSLCLIVALRSLKFGVLSLIPNLVPIALAFGVWGAFVGNIDFGVACVAGMAIGIVVDDTVHFLSKYRRARRDQGLDVDDAIRYTFSTVGHALCVTSAVLVAGFGVLSLSLFQFNNYMGLLSMLVVVFALLADFFLLPAILIEIDGGKRQNINLSKETDYEYAPVGKN